MFAVRRRWRLRQDNMSIGAAESEGVYPNQPFSIRFRKWLERSRNSQLQFIEVDVRIRRREMQAAGNLMVLKNQHRFDKSGDTSSSFKVSDIRLNGTDGERS